MTQPNGRRCRFQTIVIWLNQVRRAEATGVVPNSDSLAESDSPREHAHDVNLCRRHLRKQTVIRRRKKLHDRNLFVDF